MFLKRFAWFILKSPQRKWVGWGTLFTDVKGIFSIIIQYIYPNKSNDIIWICTGNFNRSKQLLDTLVTSLTQVKNPMAFGLSVVDCNSTDIDNLEANIRLIWKGNLIFTNTKQDFSRSSIFNMALKNAPGNLIFVCDADISVPPNLDKLIRTYVSKNTAWFPICQKQQNPTQKDWTWFTSGTGIFAATKTQLGHTGIYDESIKTWGKEDWDLYFRFYKKGMMPLRSRCLNLYHHWHPSSEPADFEKMF